MPGGVADEMVARISADTLAALRLDTATAITSAFGPIRLHALPSVKVGDTDQCSTDGYYTATLGNTPAILYADDQAPVRVRFTLLHELGHHLLQTAHADLLDPIDEIGATMRGGADAAEELVCHAFASRVLIPDAVLPTIPRGGRLRAEQVIAIHAAAPTASWEAVAVRCAQLIPGGGAVVLVNPDGTVRFCGAAGLGIGWARGSKVDPNGPLARSVTSTSVGRTDTFRWERSYAENYYCDTAPALDDGIGIGVLDRRARDGRLNIVEQPEPAWKTRESWCERCAEPLVVGWCETCHDRRCPTCDRCKCEPIVENKQCVNCFLGKPHDPGAEWCVDCEADR